MKNKTKIFASVISGLFLIVSIAPLFAGAGGTNPNEAGGTAQNPPTTYRTDIKISNPFKGVNSLDDIIGKIMDIVFQIGGVIAVLMIMYAGFTYVTSGGDPGKIKSANNTLFYTVIGAAILLGSWVLVKAIQGTINQLK
jgi:hypothetical protein